MSTVSLTNLVVLCAALAACSDTNGTVTAPDVRPALSEVQADLRGAATADGPFDVAFGPSASSAQMAASTRAATGGRASGHVGLTLGSGFFTNIAT